MLCYPPDWLKLVCFLVGWTIKQFCRKEQRLDYHQMLLWWNFESVYNFEQTFCHVKNQIYITQEPVARTIPPPYISWEIIMKKK